MIAFPSMLLEPARQAGMKVPEDADDFDPQDYMHFHVYCMTQLGASMPHPSAHWDNAKVIASLSDEKIKTITYAELLPQIAVGNSSMYQ